MISKNSGSKMYEGNITSIVKYFYYSKITTTPTPNHTYMGDFMHQMIKLPGVSILLNFPEFFSPKRQRSRQLQKQVSTCRPDARPVAHQTGAKCQNTVIKIL